MDGVGGLEPLLILPVPALRRELSLLGAVQIEERPGHGVPRHELGLIHERLEEAPAHDLEALLRAGRPPRGLDSADRIAQAIEGRATALPAHLHVLCLSVGRAGRVGGR